MTTSRRADGHSGERLITGRHAFGHGHAVGLNPVCVRAEPIAGAAKAADHFVYMEQYIVLLADALDFRPVGFRRNDKTAGTLHRLRNASFL